MRFNTTTLLALALATAHAAPVSITDTKNSDQHIVLTEGDVVVPSTGHEPVQQNIKQLGAIIKEPYHELLGEFVTDEQQPEMATQELHDHLTKDAKPAMTRRDPEQSSEMVEVAKEKMASGSTPTSGNPTADYIQKASLTRRERNRFDALLERIKAALETAIPTPTLRPQPRSPTCYQQTSDECPPEPHDDSNLHEGLDPVISTMHVRRAAPVPDYLNVADMERAEASLNPRDWDSLAALVDKIKAALQRDAPSAPANPTASLHPRDQDPIAALVDKIKVALESSAPSRDPRPESSLNPRDWDPLPALLDKIKAALESAAPSPAPEKPTASLHPRGQDSLAALVDKIKAALESAAPSRDPRPESSLNPRGQDTLAALIDKIKAALESAAPSPAPAKPTASLHPRNRDSFAAHVEMFKAAAPGPVSKIAEPPRL
jgi:hypothetical protein